MPTSAPLPAPVAAANHGVSGGTYASGLGFTQTSGTTLEYAEYRQTLQIEYTRNPRNTQDTAQTPYWSLAQLSSLEVKNVTGTSLHWNITTNSSCKKIISNYTLSSGFQMQKFIVEANKFDKVGYSYGAVSGANNQYVFGPQGSIITTQPYIRRNLWDDSVDVEFDIGGTGTSHVRLMTSSIPPSAWNVGDSDNDWGQADIYAPFFEYIPKTQYGGDISISPDFPMMHYKHLGDQYSIFGGAYNTSSEVAFGDNTAGLTRLINFIETNCSVLSKSNFYQRFPIPWPIASDGFAHIQEVDRLPLNPYYNTNYHDYT